MVPVYILLTTWTFYNIYLLCMKREYKMHARNTEDNLYAMLHELIEGIDGMDSDCVISSCEKLIEELNTIKELYTDESLL